MASLKNSEIKSLEKVSIILTMVDRYAAENPDFYTKTTLNKTAIMQSCDEVAKLVVKHLLMKRKEADAANKWNKDHPETHRRLNKEYEAKHREERRMYHRAHYRKKKAEAKEVV